MGGETEIEHSAIRSGRRRRLAVAALVAALAVCAPAAAPAHPPDANPLTAQLYWANTGTDSIGRANLLNALDVDPLAIEGATDPRGLAIDSSYLYWANTGANMIGRGNLDGTGVIQSYVTTAGAPYGIADDAAHLYWTQVVSGSGWIGRAQLDGFGPNQAFIPTGAAPCGIGVGPDFVYWANGGAPGSIGRAALDGSGVVQDFITATSDPCGLAVTGEGLFWANRTGNSIGRSNLDGTAAQEDFISGLTDPPCGISVDSGHIYWTASTGTIGRARHDGTIDTQAFVSGASDPCGVAVAPTMEATPVAEDFPDTEIRSASAPRTIVIENTSSTALDNSTLNFVGANPRDFEITSDGCTGVLPTAGSCEIRARFAPLRAGDRSAALRISGNASNHPFLIPLTGSALPDATRPRFLAASVRPGAFRKSTTLRYRLTEAARVVFTIDRRRGGKRVGRLVQAGAQGLNSKRLGRRLGGHTLDPGGYRVSVVATDRAGNDSRRRRLSFRVIG